MTERITIALDHLDGREAAALMVGGQLDDLLIDGDTPRPGTIYRAIADRPVKGQGGMFLRTPDGNAFVRQVKGIAPGQALLVQVTGHAEPGKAIPVTARVLFKSRYAIVTPEAPGHNVSRAIRDEERRVRLHEIAAEAMGASGMGLILRSACAGAGDDEISADIAQMREVAEAVTGDDAGRGPEKLLDGDGPHARAWRDWPLPDALERAPGCFAESGVLERIDDLRAPGVSLPGGANACIEPTRALVAVDVNTGPDTSPAAGLKANIALARALPRQLRLRGLGGQITLDLAPMPKRDRRVFEDTLRAAFRRDDVETVLAGWTPLGHYELQRQRGRLPLTEVMR
ncbi:ribonuclease E/G [Roseovarius ramblicola]|uniref:Ribonuclease E/G n=1 Tax=Roseovarius ramblicola TaxID=2022336 RepID=A0ABV5HXN3_9RHOB